MFNQGRVIAKTVCGSNLFGTNYVNSDMDYTAVFMRSAVSLANSRGKGAVAQSTSDTSRKNTKEDTDCTYFDLRHFIDQALTGQPFAIETLHTPEHQIVETSPVWQFVLDNKEKLRTNRIKSFMGYCYSQASKYSAKGEKYTELRAVLDAIENLPLASNASKFFVRDLTELGIFNGMQHFSVEPRRQDPEAGEILLYGPDCSFPLGRRLDEVLTVLKVKFNSFGERTKAAAEDDGTDLKAYYHALRVVWEAEEYLNEGKLTLPCPRAAELMRVRNREFSRPYIEDWIDSELTRVMSLPNNLPDPDRKFWDDFLDDVYVQHCADELRKVPAPFFSKPTVEFSAGSVQRGFNNAH
jgi:hypothetical protein